MEEISLLSNWSRKRKITTTKTKGNGTAAAAAAATTAQQWDKQQQLISELLAGKDKNAISRNMQTQRRRCRIRRGMALFAFLSWVALLQTANCQQQQQLFFPPQLYEQQGPSVEQQHRRDPSDSVSIRLIDEILEIFVPSDSFSHRRRKVGQQQAMPIPYGLNRLLPRTARSRDSPSERVDYTEEETGQIMPATERRFSPIRHQSDYGVAETMDNGQQAPWANLARDLFGIFRAMETTTPTTTTTTTTTQMSLLERLMPKLLSPFGLGTTAPAPTAPPTLFPFFTRATMTTSAPSLFSSFFRQEPPKREPIPTNPLVEPMAQLFGVEKKAVEEGRAQIDTGGQNFDRFVVREKVNPDNPFAAFVGGSKWNERGIKWEDGSIRLINKNGNSILGAETGVHDRSVNIPISRWLDIANGLVNFNQAQQDRVRRW